MSEYPSMNSLDEISHEESIGEVGYWSEKYNHKRNVTAEQRFQMLQQLSKLITIEKTLLAHSILSIILCIAVRLGHFNKAGDLSKEQSQQNIDSNFSGHASLGEQQQGSSESSSSSSSSSWPFILLVNMFSFRLFDWIQIDYYAVCILQNLLSVYLLSYRILSIDSSIHSFLSLKLHKSPQEFSSIEKNFPQAVSHESEVFEQAALKEQVFSHSVGQNISFIHVMSGLTHTKSFNAKRILVLSGAALIGYNIASISGNVELWVLLFLAFPALAVVLPQICLLLTFTFGILSATFIFSGFIVKETIRWIEAEIKAFIRKKKIQKSNRKIHENHEKETTCTICLSELHENDKSNKGVGVLPACSHAFHFTCIQLWIKEADHCPICRTQI